MTQSRRRYISRFFTTKFSVGNLDFNRHIGNFVVQNQRHPIKKGLRSGSKTNRKNKKSMKNPERILAEKLLQISAIKLQPDMPFVWGSGWNSPIYNDNRRILSYPDVRNFVKIEMARVILEHFDGAQVIASVPNGAIPIGAIVADSLGLPFIFVRDTPKDHGLENMIEGNLKPGQRVVLIEDIVSTGGTAVRASEAIRNAGGEVIGVTSVFTFEFPESVKRFREENLTLVSLSDYSTLLDAALATDYIQPSELKTLQEWRTDPANWVPERMERRNSF